MSIRVTNKRTDYATIEGMGCGPCGFDQVMSEVKLKDGDKDVRIAAVWCSLVEGYDMYIGEASVYECYKKIAYYENSEAEDAEEKIQKWEEALEKARKQSEYESEEVGNPAPVFDGPYAKYKKMAHDLLRARVKEEGWDIEEITEEYQEEQECK